MSQDNYTNPYLDPLLLEETIQEQPQADTEYVNPYLDNKELLDELSAIDLTDVYANDPVNIKDHTSRGGLSGTVDSFFNVGTHVAAGAAEGLLLRGPLNELINTNTAFDFLTNEQQHGFAPDPEWRDRDDPLINLEGMSAGERASYTFGEIMGPGSLFKYAGRGFLRNLGRNLADNSSESLGRNVDEIIALRRRSQEAGFNVVERAMIRMFPESNVAKRFEQATGESAKSLGGVVPSGVLRSAVTLDEAPKFWNTAENASLWGSAIGGVNARLAFEDSDWAQFGGELTGGVAGPMVLTTKVAQLAWGAVQAGGRFVRDTDAGRAVLERTNSFVEDKKWLPNALSIDLPELAQDTYKQRELVAAWAELVKIHARQEGQNPEEIWEAIAKRVEDSAERLSGEGASIDGVSIAALTNDPYLNRIENTMMDASPNLAEDIEAGRGQFRDTLTAVVNSFRESGDPNLVGLAEAHRRNAVISIAERRADSALEEALAATQKAFPDVAPETGGAVGLRTAASDELQEIIVRANDELKAASDALYGMSNTAAPVVRGAGYDDKLEDVASRWSYYKENRLAGNTALTAGDMKDFDNLVAGNLTHGQLHSLKVRINGKDSTGNPDLTAFKRDMLPALRELTSSSGDEAYRTAEAFYQTYIQRFRNPTIQRVLNAEQGQALDSVIVSSNDPRNAQRARDVVSGAEAADELFAEARDFTALDIAAGFAQSSTSIAEGARNEIQAGLQALAATFMTDTGVDFNKMSTYIKNNPNVLSDYPEVRARLSDAASASQAYKDAEDYLKTVKSKEMYLNDTQALAAFGNANNPHSPSTIVNKALAPTNNNPDDAYRDLANAVTQYTEETGTDGAVISLKAGTLQWVFEKSTVRRKGESVIDWPKFNSLLFDSNARPKSNRALADVMIENGVLSVEEANTLRIISDAGRVEAVSGFDQRRLLDLDAQGEISREVEDTVAKFTGLNIFSRVLDMGNIDLGPGSLVMAGKVAKLSAAILKGSGLETRADVASDILMDPEKFVRLARSPEIESMLASPKRAFRAWLKASTATAPFDFARDDEEFLNLLGDRDADYIVSGGQLNTEQMDSLQDFFEGGTP